MRSKCLASLAAALCLFAPLSAIAETSITVLGGFSNQYQNAKIEKPFFENLEKSTNGDFKARFRSIDELGLNGYDAFRQLQSGAFQIMAISPGYVSGDDPFVLGFDLPGIMPKLETAKAVADSYRSALSERIRTKFGGEVLAVWPYPASMLFCKGDVKSLTDLKGKKVRVSSAALNDLVSHFGATGVTLPFSEVYPSLQRNVVDCATAASLSGYEAKWHEVTDSLFTLPLSWTLQLHVANGDFWDGLTDQQKGTLSTSFKKMEDEMWSVAASATAEGVACSTGSGSCPFGKPASMKRNDYDAESEKALQDAVRQVVLPSWSKECNAAYPECSKVWNDTVGRVTGYSIQ